jgi:predicted metal-dependent peptidase
VTLEYGPSMMARPKNDESAYNWYNKVCQHISRQQVFYCIFVSLAIPVFDERATKILGGGPAAVLWHPGSPRFTLYLHPEVFTRLTIQEAALVLRHEIDHVILEHGSQWEKVKQDNRWYGAHELGINCQILLELQQAAELKKLYRWPAAEDCQGWHPERIAKELGVPTPELGKSEVYYYEWLKKHAPEPKTIKLKMKGSGKGEGKGTLEDMLEDLEKSHPGMDGENNLGEDDLPPEQQTEEMRRQVLARTIRSAMDSMEDADEKAGRLPGHLAGHVEGLLKATGKPKVTWKTHLRRCVSQAGRLDIYVTRGRRGRHGQPPKTTLRPKVRILVGADTSGSVSDKELNAFLVELEGIARLVDVTFVQLDHGIQNVEHNFRSSKDRAYKIFGRGGTDMRILFRALKNREHGLNPDEFGLIVMFTDGETPFPEQELVDHRVVWFITTKNCVDQVPRHAGIGYYLDPSDT